MTGEAGLGVVARDSKGNAAEEAEAIACVEGIRLATQWCRQPVIIESDCARVVAALQSKSMDKSTLSFVVTEGKELSQLLSKWRMSQVKREGNQVANELALLARRTVHSAVWLGNSPACVSYLLQNDCNNIHI
ncbi:hypothetical protein BAE44_0015498 [Dichanthelium oligosanthes]|uniref:RNase H type-1 domain-containing protein n=1 Tax=Dichanthelium oligosanthes TaxID=888268 RepID=A0A1E5VEK3_9POAL|nr:hypothetical protein BAE44_0015498 [Dichanthelium oligosanthes]